MELTSALKSELFRPVTTVVVPGSIAAGPFFIVANYYLPQIFRFWGEHPSAFVTIVGITIIASGLVLNNFGAAIEYYLIDQILKKKNPAHFDEWYAYLQLKIESEYIGQRYLRDALDRMKFELTMGPALILFAIGIVWIHTKYPLWSTAGLLLFCGFILLLVIYFVFEAYQSATTLAKVRKLLLDCAGSAA